MERNQSETKIAKLEWRIPPFTTLLRLLLLQSAEHNLGFGVFLITKFSLGVLLPVRSHARESLKRRNVVAITGSRLLIKTEAFRLFVGPKPRRNDGPLIGVILDSFRNILTVNFHD
ncbi:hypothetical protein HPP92_001030 [Vanilla planifolia]|uniref:Uncharacterized protein n=1 Tax=Vanilla planifolia TaxID=51239 RepID=A0A835RR04_VANPL|nr:hypothetical protein HPP92_001030 [Vanilla planifolia]